MKKMARRKSRRKRKNTYRSDRPGSMKSTRRDLETLEARCLLDATGFLQGTAFIDANGDGTLDTSDGTLPGASVALYQENQSGQYLQVGSPKITDSNGNYFFGNLQPGNYRIVETPPTGYANSAAQALSQLNPATVASPNSIDVTLLDPSMLNATVDENNISATAQDTFYITLFGATSTTLPQFPQFGTIPLASQAFQAPVSINGGAVQSMMSVDLVNYLNPYPSPVNSYPVLADSFIPPYGPDSGYVPSSTTPEQWNAGSIAYLVNHYGTQTLNQTDAVALQMAVWKFVCDTGSDLSSFSSGNFQIIGPYPGSAGQVQLAAEEAQAEKYITESEGKTELAEFLDATDGGQVSSYTPNAPDNGFLQSYVATGSLNFGNVRGPSLTTTPGVSPGPLTTATNQNYYPNNNSSLSKATFNESTVLAATSPADGSQVNDVSLSNGTLKLWYNDEHAMALGVNQVANLVTGTVTSGSVTVTKVSAAASVMPGDSVSGTGIPTGTTVASVDSVNSTVTLSAPATRGATETITFSRTYNVSPLNSSPSSVTSNVAVGPAYIKPSDLGLDPATVTPATLAAAELGTDTSGRPLAPSLYVTDVTADPNGPYAGDWQAGGVPYTPSAVYGTWKPFTETINRTTSTPTVSLTGATDPAKNSWNLAGGDAPPSGISSQGYGAEVTWNVSSLGLISGHTYRFYFTVHDGDQNQSGGDVGQYAITVVYEGVPVTPGGPVTVGDGQKLADSATLTGGNSPSGNITFYLFAPGANTSNYSNAVYSDKVAVNGDGTYNTGMGSNPGGYAPTMAGTYNWVAVYSGDSNNSSVTGIPEPQTVNSATPPQNVTKGTPTFSKNQVTVPLTNHSMTTAETIKELLITWPQQVNGNLQKVMLGGATIYNTSTGGGSLDTKNLQGNAAQLSIPANKTVNLVFQFAKNAAASPYSFTVTFTDGTSVDPTFTATSAAADTDSNTAYVSQAYMDVLGRAVDPASLAAWTQALANGVSRITFGQALTHSDEYYSTKIDQAYARYLDRSADDTGLQYWIGQYHLGMTDEELEAQFIGSPEYYAHSGGTDKAWVDALYFDLLGRAPDASGETYWVDALAAGTSRTAVALGFASSDERESAAIQDDYETFLGRPAGATEIAQWVAAFQNGMTNEDVVGGFVGSDEYFKLVGGVQS